MPKAVAKPGSFSRMALQNLFLQRPDEHGVRWPSPVKGEQCDYGLLFANRTTIGIKSQSSGDLLPVFLFRRLILSVELLMNDGQRFLLATATENSVVSDTHETFWEDVQRKSSDKFPCIQRHDFLFAGIAIILVMKGHGVLGGVE